MSRAYSCEASDLDSQVSRGFQSQLKKIQTKLKLYKFFSDKFILILTKLIFYLPYITSNDLPLGSQFFGLRTLPVDVPIAKKYIFAVCLILSSIERIKKTAVIADIWNILSYINDWIFVMNGGYRSLIERLFFPPVQSLSNIEPHFAIMDLQLVLCELQKIATFMPGNSLKLALAWVRRQFMFPIQDTATKSHQPSHYLCGLCSKLPKIPCTVSSCRHLFCHFCLQKQFLNCGNRCPLCSLNISTINRSPVP